MRRVAPAECATLCRWVPIAPLAGIMSHLIFAMLPPGMLGGMLLPSCNRMKNFALRSFGSELARAR